MGKRYTSRRGARIGLRYSCQLQKQRRSVADLELTRLDIGRILDALEVYRQLQQDLGAAGEVMHVNLLINMLQRPAEDRQ